MINTNAGSGQAKASADAIIQALKQKNITHQTYYTERPNHAFELTAQLLKTTLVPWKKTDSAESFPLLVVLGGDGTLHEVINALGDNLSIPVSYIPCGSGNDFARGVGLSRKPLEALEHILATRQPQEYTILAYHEKNQAEYGLVTNNVGIGIDAAIVAQANDSAYKKLLNKYRLGSLTYLLVAFHVLFKQKGFPLKVQLVKEELLFSNVLLCTVTNHPYFGGGIAIAPNADSRNNWIDLVLVEKINIFKIFYLIFLLLQKKHMHSKYVHHYQAKQLTLVSPTKQFGQADGEELGQRTYDIKITTKKRLFWL